ncbi:MAG: hypothetical protein NT118_14660, partial [Lentisphaerae bacterium]|nr:hypothetical protein [Lentisphaerota bacterium]
EDFFLDVIKKARSESVKTYGAEGGGDIAGYLKHEDNPQDILKTLSAPDKAGKKAEEEKKTVEAREDSSEKAKETLGRLVSAKEEHGRAEQEKPESIRKTEDLDLINKKLSHLVSKKDSDRK